jgi:hypothetical protein
MLRWPKRICLGLLLLLFLGAAFLAIATARAKLPGKEVTLAGRIAGRGENKMHERRE